MSPIRRRRREQFACEDCNNTKIGEKCPQCDKVRQEAPQEKRARLRIENAITHRGADERVTAKGHQVQEQVVGGYISSDQATQTTEGKKILNKYLASSGAFNTKVLNDKVNTALRVDTRTIIEDTYGFNERWYAQKPDVPQTQFIRDVRKGLIEKFCGQNKPFSDIEFYTVFDGKDEEKDLGVSLLDHLGVDAYFKLLPHDN